MLPNYVLYNCDYCLSAFYKLESETKIVKMYQGAREKNRKMKPQNKTENERVYTFIYNLFDVSFCYLIADGILQ